MTRRWPTVLIPFLTDGAIFGQVPRAEPAVAKSNAAQPENLPLKKRNVEDMPLGRVAEPRAEDICVGRGSEFQPAANPEVSRTWMRPD